MSNEHMTSESVIQPSHQDSMGGAIWPIHRTSLSTLVDLGLNDGQIATYFSVNQTDVKRLCRQYGLRP